MLACDPTPTSFEVHEEIIAVANSARSHLNRRRGDHGLSPLTHEEFVALDGTVYWKADDRSVRYRHANIEYLWTERGYFSWYRIDQHAPYPACLLTGEPPVQRFCV